MSRFWSKLVYLELYTYYNILYIIDNTPASQPLRLNWTSFSQLEEVLYL